LRSLESTEDRASIRGRILALTPSDHRRWGKMSVEQMICHLRDSYQVALGEKTASPATGFLQRTLVKWIALSAPMRWPKGVRTRPEIEQGAGGTAPGQFEEDRAALVSILDRFRNETLSNVIPHPYFGPMTPAEWLRWGYLHAGHHLRQFGR
jgi:DinB superfamily